MPSPFKSPSKEQLVSVADKKVPQSDQKPVGIFAKKAPPLLPQPKKETLTNPSQASPGEDSVIAELKSKDDKTSSESNIFYDICTTCAIPTTFRCGFCGTFYCKNVRRMIGNGIKLNVLGVS